MTKMKREKLNLTVSPEHKAKAEKLAKKLNRSKSNLFEWLIDRASKGDDAGAIPGRGRRNGNPAPRK